MFERLRSWLFHFLRVPPEPEPPVGDPRSLRIFRASRKLFYLRLVRWGFSQLAALAAILFWLGVIMVSEREAQKLRAQGSQGGVFTKPKPGRNRVTLEPLRRVPPIVFQGLRFAKAAGSVVYLPQLLITYVAIRLDYELRWCAVTDRSLRIRSGLWTVQETTMSFANLQQVVVMQGPLQRLLGISDVRVESAGGGCGGSSEGGQAQSMHAGVFHGVENATHIRDLILERLRQFRETGLGNFDETPKRVDTPGIQSISVGTHLNDVLAASRELLEQARKLSAACLGKTP
jgi:hypothetical protein